MRCCILFALLCVCQGVYAQSDTVLSLSKQQKYIASVTEEYSSLNRQLDKKTTAYLNKVQKEQAKLLDKLNKKDSNAAKALQQKFTADFNAINNKLAAAANPKQLTKLKEYLPGFDTATSTFSFLEKNNLGNNPELAAGLTKGKEALQVFENKMQAATEIKKQLQQQRDALKQQFEKLGMVKELKSLNKQVYYYQQQLNEYKSYLKDPKKAQQKALAILKKTSLFKSFMKKHSMLAQLFKVPENYGSPENLAGLQTRASVQQMLNTRLGSMGQGTASANANPQQAIQPQIQAAQGQLNKLKDKIAKLGGNSSNMEMPDFTPNSQKTKKFAERIEYGFNVQSQKARYYFPATSDIAVTAGYKINDKSTVGFGLGYKLGLGRGWDNMKLTSEGVSLRSFVDIKTKGSFWLSGGYEQNYLQSFKKIAVLKDMSAWKQSALLGLTKKIKLSKNKTSSIQLLYDFLHNQNQLTSPALQFRVGWGL